MTVRFFHQPAGFLCSWLLLLAFVSGTSRAQYEDLDSFIERGMELWHVPGMAVAVVSSDAIPFSRGFGQTAVSGGQPVDEHTLFALASLNKAMLVSGLLMLVDEGRLSLDEPITRYIPELHFAPPMPGETIRVRDLLAHRTGLPSTDFWSFFQQMPLAEQITRLQYVSQEAPVRSRLIYQNTMFDLAGLLIERISGQRWDAFLRLRLWQPIGMLETVSARGQIEERSVHVLPFFYVGGELIQADWDLPADATEAAGSTWSSLHDMSLWAQFLLRGGVTAGGKRLLSEAAFTAMFEPQQLASVEDFYPTVALTLPHWRSYALAWFQQDFQGRMINFHTGSLDGLVALIGLDREGDRAVVVLGNRDHAELRHAVLWEVMDGTSGPGRPDWNQAVFDLYMQREFEADAKWREMRRKRLKNTQPSLPLAAYTGAYRSRINGDIFIEHQEGRLHLNTAQRSMPLRHWQIDTFLLDETPRESREFLTFHIGSDSTVTALDLLGDSFQRVQYPESPES